MKDINKQAEEHAKLFSRTIWDITHDRIPTLTEKLREQLEAWKDTAAQNQRNADFWRGLVVQMGDMLGPETRVDDAGDTHDDVLGLRVPEVLSARLDELSKLQNYVDELINQIMRQCVRQPESKSYCLLRCHYMTCAVKRAIEHGSASTSARAHEDACTTAGGASTKGQAQD